MRLGQGVLSALVVALAAVGPFAATTHGQSNEMGTARNAIGTLIVVRPDGIEDRLKGKGAVKLFEEDVLRTEPGSQALVEMVDGITLALNENTAAKLLTRWEKGKRRVRIVRLRQGEVWVKTAEGQKALEVETPVATAVVRETEFNMKVHTDGQTVLTVIQGIVEFGTAFGTCPIRTSTVSYGVRGKRCTRPEAVDVTPVTRWSQAVRQQ
jgi:ferric-dicitrate binding protein FerR (iron transport regulator)